LGATGFKKMSWAVVAATLLCGTARAAEVTRVVSAQGEDDKFDFNLTLWWLHQVESSFVKRESESIYSAQTEIIRDSKYTAQRDTLNLRADFGLLWDVGIHIQAPLVLSDSSSLYFDQSDGGNCVYPMPANPSAPRPTCVNSQNSQLLGEGILPFSKDATGQVNGFGINAPAGKPFPTSSNQIFQSPNRKGFQNLGIGVTWAAFNQLRDDTKPTWTLSFDALLDVFKDMGFDPANPGANTAVGPGYHQLVFSTFVSKRFRYFDPFIGAWYMLPIRTNNSIFQTYPNQTTNTPQQQAGIVAGVEQIAWENVPARQRVTIEARVSLQEFFFGRGYSELWQPLAGASNCNEQNPGNCRPNIDLQYMDGNNQVMRPYPGVTDIDPYAVIGGQLGLNVQVGRYVRFHGLFGLSAAAPHNITGTSPGIDLNGDGRVDANEPVNAAYREAIDIPGRRFRVEGTQIWSLLLEGSMMF
jgi:hypothetical protein